MATSYRLLDPMTDKMHDYVITSRREEHLYNVLDTVCKNQCPPDTDDYLCEKTEADEGNELLQCAKCYQLWANKVSGANSQRAKRLLEAIDMAARDKCPTDLKDMLCKASEDESTDEETCARCIQRWATIPFAVFRK